MSGSLLLLVPLAMLLGGVALGAFFWSLKSGQYEDLDGAAERILLEDEADEQGDKPHPDDMANKID